MISMPASVMNEGPKKRKEDEQVCLSGSRMGQRCQAEVVKFIVSVVALTCSLGPAQQRDLKIEPIRVNRRLALVMGNAAYRGSRWSTR